MYLNSVSEAMSKLHGGLDRDTINIQNMKAKLSLLHKK